MPLSLRQAILNFIDTQDFAGLRSWLETVQIESGNPEQNGWLRYGQALVVRYLRSNLSGAATLLEQNIKQAVVISGDLLARTRIF